MGRILNLKNQNETSLDMRIDSLRDLTSALLDEVKTLSVLKTLDINSGIDLYTEVRRFETHLIERALEQTGGNQKRAARLLNLNLTTLNSKIKRYEVSHARRRNGGGVDAQAAEDNVRRA